MKKIITLVIVSVLLSVTNVMSQNDNYLTFQYDISFATGDMGEFISKPSFRGASAQYRNAITDNILVGADLAWNVFYEKKDYGSYTIDTRTLTGVQYRYQNMVPILISADYIFTPEKDFQPYVGLGIGTIFNERATDMNLYRLVQNPWQFAIKPELGFIYYRSNGPNFRLGFKYYNAFKTGDMETQGYFTISTGFMFTL